MAFDVESAREEAGSNVRSDWRQLILYACDEIDDLRIANAEQRERLANAGVRYLLLSERAEAAEAKVAELEARLKIAHAGLKEAIDISMGDAERAGKAEAKVAELEKQCDASIKNQAIERSRAEQAEQRAEKLRGALQRIAGFDPMMPGFIKCQGVARDAIAADSATVEKGKP